MRRDREGESVREGQRRENWEQRADGSGLGMGTDFVRAALCTAALL